MSNFLPGALSPVGNGSAWQVHHIVGFRSNENAELSKPRGCVDLALITVNVELT